jgi:hypothetical protein
MQIKLYIRCYHKFGIVLLIYMPKNSKPDGKKWTLSHWGRMLIAIFALLIAATHLASATPSGSFSAPSASRTTNSSSTATHTGYSAGGGGGFSPLSLWIDIEVIAYTIIAVVFLLGIRTWYAPAVLFNAFNLGIYFLSGVVAIPGISAMAFGGRLAFLSGSPLSTTFILVFSWVAALIIGLLLLKYDKGSGLDALMH